MSITAKDIQEQGFEHSRKGYDVEEVDVFLERVAVEVDALTRQNQELRARVAELSEKAANEPVASAEPQIIDSGLAEEEKASYEAQIADLQKKGSDLEAKISDLEANLARKGEDESAISAAIISAQKSADNIREEARVEGEKIYKEAENKAREIVRDALSDKQKTLTELEQLKKSRDAFQTEYKELLERFTNVADKEFAADASKAETPMDAADVAAAEKAVIAEVRSSAASSSYPGASSTASAPRQQAMPMPGTKTPAAKAPGFTSRMAVTPGKSSDIGAFGDTEDIDIDEID